MPTLNSLLKNKSIKIIPKCSNVPDPKLIFETCEFIIVMEWQRVWYHKDPQKSLVD